jgi:hypothetical protein
MYAYNIQRAFEFDSNSCRAAARVSAVVLVTSWLAAVLAEAIRDRFAMPPTLTLYQGFMLAVAFAGYVIGWRHELAGGVVAILGTIAFFVVNYLTIGVLPGIGAAIFAVPGVFYLVAWNLERTSGPHIAGQP